MNKSKDVSTIFSQFNIWVQDILQNYGGEAFHWSLEEYHGFCPPYLGKDIGHGDHALPRNKDGSGGKMPYVPFIIQQIKEEIYQFIELLLKHGQLDTALEIGIGHFGGTHFLFSQFFNSVTTIEVAQPYIQKFLNSTSKPLYQDIICNSHFIHGHSDNIPLRSLPYQKYDLLFIDGDHGYDDCKKDYLKYHTLVKPNGIVAFHDSHNQSMGSAQYINTLRDKLNLIDIWHPEGYGGGISYYIVE